MWQLYTILVAVGLQLNVSRFCFHHFLFVIYQLNDGLFRALLHHQTRLGQGSSPKAGQTSCPWDAGDLPTKAVLLQATTKICFSISGQTLPRPFCSFGRNQTNIGTIMVLAIYSKIIVPICNFFIVKNPFYQNGSVGNSNVYIGPKLGP